MADEAAAGAALSGKIATPELVDCESGAAGGPVTPVLIPAVIVPAALDPGGAAPGDEAGPCTGAWLAPRVWEAFAGVAAGIPESSADGTAGITGIKGSAATGRVSALRGMVLLFDCCFREGVPALPCPFKAFAASGEGAKTGVPPATGGTVVSVAGKAGFALWTVAEVPEGVAPAPSPSIARMRASAICFDDTLVCEPSGAVFPGGVAGAAPDACGDGA